MTAAAKKETAKVSKELQREDPNFLPTVYGLNKSKLAKLKKDYDISLMPEALVKGDEGYEFIHKKAMAIVKVRTNIDKEKKKLTDDARKWTTKVNGEAKRFTEIVADIEKPWKDKKAELDNAAEIKAEQERTAELARTEALEARINSIQEITANLVGASASILRERLNLAESIVVDESFEEYENAAIMHRDNTVNILTSAISEREAFEAQQEELDKGRRELAEAQALIAKMKRDSGVVVGDESTAIENCNIKSVSNDDFKESPNTSNFYNNVQSEDTEPYINLTEPQMVKEYISQLTSLETPDVGNEAMVNLVLQITSTLEKLSKFVDANIRGE